MPRHVRTARGEIVDFDAIVIKQQLAEAPMKIDVARRKEFIDSKETKLRGAKKPPVVVEDAKKAELKTEQKSDTLTLKKAEPKPAVPAEKTK